MTATAAEKPPKPGMGDVFKALRRPKVAIMLALGFSSGLPFLLTAATLGYWLRDEDGRLTRAFEHICWDGCMFSNKTMLRPDTWREILATMIAVRNAHGWDYATHA